MEMALEQSLKEGEESEPLERGSLEEKCSSRGNGQGDFLG